MPGPNTTIALDGVPAALSGAAETLKGAVVLTVPEGMWALLALYGQVQVNAGTVLNRVVTGVEWSAFYRRSASGSDTSDSKFQLGSREGDSGRLSWTYQNGEHPVARVLLDGEIFFRFGAVQTAAVPAGVTHALAAIRGYFIPKEETSMPELIRLLTLVR